MKQLYTADSGDRFEAKSSFLNCYLHGDTIGAGYESIKAARDARLPGLQGVTLEIYRTTSGDFTVEKVEEF